MTFKFLLLSLLLFWVPLSKGDHCTPIAFFVIRACCSADQLPADLSNNGKFQYLKETPFLRKAVFHKEKPFPLSYKTVWKTKKTVVYNHFNYFICFLHAKT